MIQVGDFVSRKSEWIGSDWRTHCKRWGISPNSPVQVISVTSSTIRFSPAPRTGFATDRFYKVNLGPLKLEDLL